MLNSASHEKGKYRQIVLAGMVGLALIWCLDAALDTIILKQNSFVGNLLTPSLHNILERLTTIGLVAAFLAYVNRIIQRRERLTDVFHDAMLEARRENARTEGILAAIGDGVSIQDTDYRILYQNQAHKDLIGGDFVGQFCYTAYSCRDTVCPDCPLAMCFRNGIVHKIQKSGLSRIRASYIEITASPLRDEEGNIIAGIELLRDVSQSRQAEEALRTSEARFRNLVENSSDWVWEVDARGVYAYASPRIVELLGYIPDEVIGRTPFDFMPQGEARRVAAIFSALTAEKRPIRSLENTNLHKDGHPVILETNGVPFFDAAGTFCGYRGIDRDITDRKQAENKIRNLNETLAHRAAQLVNANRELEAFSSSVSHDLRTPLTRIYSASQILRDAYLDKLGEVGPVLVQTICDACENMEELIEALLSLSRVSGSQVNRSACDLSQIAGLVAAELQLSEPDRQVKFMIAQGLTEEADPRLIKVLFENLIGNAWKYTGKTVGAEIEIGETDCGAEKVYFVRDNGAGFDMSQSPRLFKPFQRLHNRTEFKGTGIGLATVQRIAERHGGRVWGEGEPGRGATFYFTLK
jgi:PAS domain S-box-containing protein